MNGSTAVKAIVRTGSLVSRISLIVPKRKKREAPKKLSTSPAPLATSKTVKDNLNLRVADSYRDEAISVQLTAPVQLRFQGIAKSIASTIRETPYVVGCMAWLTDRMILDALLQCKGVALAITNDTCHNNEFLRKQYDALAPLSAGDVAIRCMGLRTGKSRSLMHHKFLVGLDASLMPTWVTTGSYNASASAYSHLETSMFIPCPKLASEFHQEFLRVFEAARPLPKQRSRKII